jgi:L-rhamnose mutarotase
MKRFALTLDLKDDEHLISEYERLHQQIWPEIVKSITSSGILNMEIYRLDTRLFMLIDATNEFSFEEKSKKDAANDKVQEWEELMWNYQQKIPSAKPGEKWVLMNKIFELG